MAYYKPCKNCAVPPDSCAKRQSVKGAISGLHVTSVNFVCRARKPMFRPGQRVQFPWSHFETSEYDYTDENKLIFCGTVLVEGGLKFIVRVDEIEGAAADENSEPMHPKNVFRNDRLVVKVRPSQMTALDEPDRNICPNCTAYEGETSRCHGFGKPGNWDSYWPADCLNAPADQ